MKRKQVGIVVYEEVEVLDFCGPFEVFSVTRLNEEKRREEPSPFNAFLVLLFLGVLRIVQDYAIYPRLIGQGIHLHPLAVIFAILAGEKLAGVAGIFLAIPVVAILTVSYRHWLEHRGSEGFADLLEPTPAEPVKFPAAEELDTETTPEQMVRARPDLTTGELKMPES